MVKFTIIVPTFNSSGTLDACLESIVNQTFRDVEVIIQDGMSTDATVFKANLYYDKIPALTVISEKDHGIYDAMNKGIARAKGDWILFLGSDDRLADENVLADMSKSLSGDASFVYGNVLIEGKTLWAAEDSVYDGIFDADKLARKNICHQAIFYRKSLFETFGVFDLKYKIWADWVFNLKVFSKVKTLFVNRIVAVFKGEGTSTSVIDDVFHEDYYYLVVNYLNLSIFSPFFAEKTLFMPVAKRLFREKKITKGLLVTFAFLKKKLSS